MSHLSEILRRLNQATRVVARNHSIKRFPVSKEIPSLTEPELMDEIRKHILFLEQPHFSYLMFAGPSQKDGDNKVVSKGQPRVGPPLLNFGIRL